MSHAFKSALAAVAALAVSLAHGLTVVPDAIVEGQYGASLQGTHTLAGTFADRYDFLSPVDGLLTVALESATPIGTAGVYFSGYQLDEGAVVLTEGQPSQLVIGPLPVVAGRHLLTLGIVAAPALTADVAASTRYTGTLSILALPVPEPSTWLTMAVGSLMLAFRFAGAASPLERHPVLLRGRRSGFRARPGTGVVV